MILIVGLGNPGEKYKNTRHNLGFMVIDALAKRLKAEPFKFDKKRDVELAEGMATFEGQKKHVRFLLAKPQTYMNESGRAVRALTDYHKIRTDDQLWVIHDDLDIELGTIRIRLEGSSAGQKGVQSIIDHLGTNHFARIRMGIKPEGGQKIPAEDFVLKNFSKVEKDIINEEIEEAIGVLLEGLDQGLTPKSL